MELIESRLRLGMSLQSCHWIWMCHWSLASHWRCSSEMHGAMPALWRNWRPRSWNFGEEEQAGPSDDRVVDANLAAVAADASSRLEVETEAQG